MAHPAFRKKRHKFGAIAVEADGHRFDSKAEHKRYQELRILQRSGRIAALEIHPRYDLHAVNKDGKKKIGQYEADFAYDEIEAGFSRRRVVEDVKGMRTPLYSWKKRHFEVEYWPLKITEINP